MSFLPLPGHRSPGARRWIFALAAGLLVPTPGRAQDLPVRPDFRLDTLEVSVGSRLGVPNASFQVLNAAELAQLPVRDLSEALRWVRGVDVLARSRAQADVSIRGGTFEQVLVMVDGVRMNDPQTGHFHLDLALPLSRIQRIEVLRGPASAAYGADAFGGVIHIITKDGRDLTTSRAEVAIEAGSFESTGVSFDGTGTLGDWRLGGGYVQDRSDGHREGTDFRAQQARVSVAGPLASGVLHLDADKAVRDFGAAEFYAPFPSYEETETQGLSGRWLGQVTPKLSLETSVSYRRHDDDFVLRRGDPEFYRNVHRSDRWTGGAVVRGKVSDRATMALGAEWSRESLESSNLGEREQDLVGFFGEARTRFGRVDALAGIRFDDREVGETFVSPSFSVGFAATDRLTVRGATGRSFRAPTWTDRYYRDPANEGNPDLAPEKGWSAEGGIDIALPEVGGGRIAVTAFRRETSNLIDWAKPVTPGDDEPWRTRKVEQAVFTGLELGVNDIGLGRVRAFAEASWLRLEATEEQGFLSKSSLRPLHRTLAVGAWSPIAAGVSARVMVRDNQRRFGDGGVHLDTRVRWIVDNHEMYVDAVNLLDTDYADVTGLPIPGRSFSVGFKTQVGGS